MAEQCQDCGACYDTVYRVPNEVWSEIAPHTETLGPYPEHQFGGLLCMGCAADRAESQGIRLYWEASVGDWRENLLSPPPHVREALERIAAGTYLPKPENSFLQCSEDCATVAYWLAEAMASAPREGD